MVIGVGFFGCLVVLIVWDLGVFVVVFDVKIIGYGGLGCNVGLVNVGFWMLLDEIEVVIGKCEGLYFYESFSVVFDYVFFLIDWLNIECNVCCNGILYCVYVDIGLVDLKLWFK